jgi:hypothetical protein
MNSGREVSKPCHQNGEDNMGELVEKHENSLTIITYCFPWRCMSI